MLSRLLGGVTERISRAQVYALDPNATAMCANVFLSRPSSILAALPFAKLPAESVWIEFSNIAAREAFAQLGNQNEWKEGGVLIERSGFLLTESEGVIEMEAIAQYRPPDGERFVELMSARCRFDASTDFDLDLEHMPAPGRIDHGATGRAKRYYDLISRDDREIRALQEIKQRFEGGLHPDFLDASEMLAGVGEEAVMRTVTGHVEDMYRFFTIQVLPALILLNCRNAVATEAVPAPEKLNKARRQKGKAEIGPYRLVRLHLVPRHGGTHRQGGHRDGPIERHLVVGHFKVRASGLFWWGYHYRGELTPGGTRRVNVVTR
jgi:hypothetical protein